MVQDDAKWFPPHLRQAILLRPRELLLLRGNVFSFLPELTNFLSGVLLKRGLGDLFLSYLGWPFL